jgi:hypothetical protein
MLIALGDRDQASRLRRLDSRVPPAASGRRRLEMAACISSGARKIGGPSLLHKSNITKGENGER